MRKLGVKKIVLVVALSILLTSVFTYNIAIGAFTARNIYLEDIPATSNYVVRNEGAYTWVTQDNGDIVNSSTNDEVALQYSIDQTTVNGGTVTVLSGTYSATVTLKNQVTLILNKGTSSITVNIDAGANATLIDMESSIYKQWENGSLKLHIDGETIYAGGDTNYVAVNSSGLSLSGTARVYRGAWVPATGLKAAIAKPATFVDHGISGAWEFSDNAEEQVVANIRIPSDADITEDLTILIGWSSPAQSLNCAWNISYLLTSLNENTSASAQQVLASFETSSSTANGLIVSSFTIVNAQIVSTDFCVHISILRDGDETGDTLSDVAHLHGICLDYTSDKLGETP